MKRRATDKGKTYLGRQLLSTKLLHACELEKKRIARDLHDGVGQILTQINLRIDQCMANIQQLDDPQLRSKAEQCLESLPALVSEAMDEVRGIYTSIRPAELDDLGVLQAINNQCRRFGEGGSGIRIDTVFSVREAEIPEALRTSIYRITQEALNNAMKHARASRILVSLTAEEDALSLTIEDNGAGFDPRSKLNRQALPGNSGIGLSSMKERAESQGGRFEIISGKGLGTTICVDWPVRSETFKG